MWRWYPLEAKRSKRWQRIVSAVGCAVDLFVKRPSFPTSFCFQNPISLVLFQSSCSYNFPLDTSIVVYLLLYFLHSPNNRKTYGIFVPLLFLISTSNYRKIPCLLPISIEEGETSNGYVIRCGSFFLDHRTGLRNLSGFMCVVKLVFFIFQYSMASVCLSSTNLLFPGFYMRCQLTEWSPGNFLNNVIDTLRAEKSPTLLPNLASREPCNRMSCHFSGASFRCWWSFVTNFRHLSKFDVSSPPITCHNLIYKLVTNFSRKIWMLHTFHFAVIPRWSSSAKHERGFRTRIEDRWLGYYPERTS